MIVEVRSYRLHPGTHAEFRRRFHAEALPMLRRRAIDVVAFGASMDDADGAFLIRAFDDLDDRRRREDAFYSSAEWRSGPREPILACIETYSDIVFDLDEATIDGLRRLGLGPSV
jgi:hypothetical protein